MRRLVAAAFVTLVAAAPAAAQDYKPIEWNIGFGATFPTADFKQNFDAGWNGTFGVTFNINEHLGVQGEYIYSRMEGPDKVISLTANPIGGAITNGLLQSNHQMHVGNVNLVYRGGNRDSGLGGYVLGGLGLYHRMIQLTSPSVGYTTFCDPWWYVCYPVAVSVDTIIGDRSSNDFGINFGGGITFGHEAKFYIEARYHYVWGPTITPTTPAPSASVPTNVSSNASYFPLMFGVRF
jgi:opacity protein-like surface antigen